MKGQVRNYPEFTHFLSLPFIRNSQRQSLHNLQRQIQDIFSKYKVPQKIQRSSNNLMHITLGMLTLNRWETRSKASETLLLLEKEIWELMTGAILIGARVRYFTKWNHKAKRKEVSVIYLDLQKNQEFKRLEGLTHLLIKEFIKQEVIDCGDLKQMYIGYDHKTGKYFNQDYHATLFYAKDLFEDDHFMQLFKQISDLKIQIPLQCDSVDISTRFHYDGSNFYEPLARINLKNFS